MGKKFNIGIIALVVAIILVGCRKEVNNEPISRAEIFMGTPITVTLYSGGSQDTVDEVFNMVSEIENLVSINKEGTELELLNKSAGKSPIELSETSYEIIKKGLEYSKLSDGKYDISIGPVVKLWGIGSEGAKVPSKEEIEEAIELVGYSNIDINDSTKEVYLEKEGMILDLGSIAKGYTADEISRFLKDEGVTEAIIDLGGNIYTLGKKNNTKEWKIGIQDPFSERGNIVGTIDVSNKSVVTTGVYERFIEEDGVRYHHILNPKTGYPYETEIAGVSIVADNSIDADALSTLVFTKGLHEGIDFVESLDNIDAIFITNDKKIYTTSGLSEKFILTDEDFEICN